jgi:genome maintenance exonuclease 1
MYYNYVMKLLTEKYQYTPINRQSVKGKRLYSCPDGSKVPSVTTILSATKPEEDKAALQAWRKAVGYDKAQQITTEAASRGTRMHKFLEDFVAQGFLNESGSNPYSQQSHKMAQHIIDHGLKNVNEVWGNEVALYYPELYAGTTDAVGLHKGEPAILDYKQSNKPKKREYIEDYYLQLAAYSIAHNKIHETNIQKGVVLMCVKPPELKPWVWGEPQYQEFILEGSEFNKYVNKWWDRVDMYYSMN